MKGLESKTCNPFKKYMEREYRWNGKFFMYCLLHVIIYSVRSGFISQFLLREAEGILSDA
jgi:hypothetical protein